MKFSKDKCQVLHLRRKKAFARIPAGSEWWGSSSAEEDLGVLVDSRLDISAPHLSDG